MKKFNLIFVLIAVTATIFSSCTVQRRYHRKGFNINWNHTSINVKKDRHITNETDVSDESIAINDNSQVINEVKSEIVNYSNVVSENNVDEAINSDNQEQSLDFETKTTKYQNVTKSEPNKKLNIKRKIKEKIFKKEAKNDEAKKPINGWALTAFILSIISLFASFWGAFLCALLVIIFALIANKQMKANPEKYRGAKLVKWALLLVTIAMALWSIYFFLIA